MMYTAKMIKVAFVCLGNICRSTMAEFLFRKMIENKGISNQFEVASMGTHAMTGSCVYHGTARVLDRLDIDYSKKRSTQLIKSDGEYFDYLIGMDKRNIQDMRRILSPDNEHKIHLLMSYTGIKRDIADPYYTGDFELTYKDVVQGLEAFLLHLGL